MSKKLLNHSTVLENVHKFIYLVSQWPEKTSREIGSLFAVPGFDINAAIWLAQDLGILELNPKTGKTKIAKPIKEYNFGKDVHDFMDTILYVIGKFNEEGVDIEEENFKMWTQGVPPQDIFVAVKRLLEQKKIVEYQIISTDLIPPSKKKLGRGGKPKKVENEYIFYTLAENADKKLGKNKFKDQTTIRIVEAEPKKK